MVLKIALTLWKIITYKLKIIIDALFGNKLGYRKRSDFLTRTDASKLIFGEISHFSEGCIVNKA
jgi:hypothetical protein